MATRAWTRSRSVKRGRCPSCCASPWSRTCEGCRHRSPPRSVRSARPTRGPSGSSSSRKTSPTASPTWSPNSIAPRHAASNAFYLRLAQRLVAIESGAEVINSWLERRLSSAGVELHQAQVELQQKRASNQVSIANSITSIRFLDAFEWREFFEHVSLVEHELQRDPVADVPGDGLPEPRPLPPCARADGPALRELRARAGREGRLPRGRRPRGRPHGRDSRPRGMVAHRQGPVRVRATRGIPANRPRARVPRAASQRGAVLLGDAPAALSAAARRSSPCTRSLTALRRPACSCSSCWGSSRSPRSPLPWSTG